MSKAEEKRQREQLIRQVRRLTRARVNDAVKLAYLSGEALEAIDGLDLTAMTEFKRAGNGAVEIKFTDRLKALEKLMELIRENRETEAEELLRTLGGTAEDDLWRDWCFPQNSGGCSPGGGRAPPTGTGRPSSVTGRCAAARPCA